MRLIDADEIVTVEDIYDEMTEEWHKEKLFIKEALEKWTDEGCPPTVEAIPIKWIEHYVKNHFCLDDWYGGFIGGVNMMLDDWEKENETD